MAILDLNGTSVRTNRINYIEKRLAVDDNREKAIRIVFFSGAELTVWYGFNAGKRDNDYNRLLRYL